MNRRADRQAAIAAGLAELSEERALAEAEEAAHAEAMLESMERETLREQKEILRRHPASQFFSLEEWQEALQEAGFYYTDIEEYQQVLKHPDACFGSYYDEGDGWYGGRTPYRVHLTDDDVDAELDRWGLSPDDEPTDAEKEHRLQMEILGEYLD